MPRPWNKKIPQAQREREAQRLAEICAQTSAAAEELRWDVFVDTMIAVAAELTPASAVKPRTATDRIDDTGRPVGYVLEPLEQSANSILE